MLKIIVANSLRTGSWFRLKPACCTVEQNQVSVPQPVAEVSNSSSVRDYSIDFDTLGRMLYAQERDYNAQSETIVTFLDSDTNLGSGMSSGNHVFSTSDSTQNIDLNQWLKRPTRISSFVWNESDTIGTTTQVTPWRNYLNTNYVVTKMNNYSWLRGDMKIRIQITASPFYYGMMKVVYRPLVNIRGNSITSDGAFKFLINLSQLPSIDVIPGKQDAYEMTLPFLYHQNYVNLQSLAAVTDLGRLDYVVYNGLESANGVSGSGITVATYAWFEDVELSGASCGYAVQSDEYGEGAVSKPASWVASAASYFENIPVIGPFATATRIGAGAISSIARLFGFTNVPVIADSTPMRPEAFPKLASSEIGFPVEKLTFDPKNELSVDPRIVGLQSGTDEMNICNITSHESFLTRVSWLTSDAADYLLFYSRINPSMFDIDAAANPQVFTTPMCMVSKAFADWRGSIIFRFQFIVSKYHKGKVIISFDPSGSALRNLGNQTNTSSVVYTTIVDLGETQDVEFEIPYQQAVQFLNLRSTWIANKNFASRTTYASHIVDPNYDNGLITVRVLNTLTAPIATSSIDMNVYVRGGKDLEFNNPAPIVDNITNSLTFYAPQSEEMSERSDTQVIEMAPTASLPDKQYLVHYGENIRSLRTLLRRYNHLQTEALVTPATGNYSDVLKTIYRFPISPGFTTLSTTPANKNLTIGTANYNFCNMTALSWFANNYLCYRGSTNWTFNTDTALKTASLYAYRAPYSNPQASLSYASTPITNANTINQYMYNQAISGTAGMALTNTNIQPGLNIVNNSYSRFKYQYCLPLYSNQGNIVDATNQGCVAIKAWVPPYSTSATSQYGTISTYVAAGTDFGLYFFMNTPTVWILTQTVTYA